MEMTLPEIVALLPEEGILRNFWSLSTGARSRGKEKPHFTNNSV